MWLQRPSVQNTVPPVQLPVGRAEGDEQATVVSITTARISFEIVSSKDDHA
jgi:hypothetical protein